MIEPLEFEKRASRRKGIIVMCAFVAWLVFMLWMFSSGQPANAEQGEPALVTPEGYWEPEVYGCTPNIHKYEPEDRVTDGILWLVTPALDRKEKILKVYQHKVIADDVAYRYRLANAFIRAGAEFDIDPWLLVGIGYRESIFDMTQIGDGGRAHGIMQVHPQGRKACAEYCGEMNTPWEQISCGACWLDKGRKWCGDLDGGLFGYISGRCTTIEYDRRKAHRIRRNLQRKLTERFGSI